MGIYPRQIHLSSNNCWGRANFPFHQAPDRLRFWGELKALRQRTQESSGRSNFVDDLSSDPSPDCPVIHAIVGKFVELEKPGYLMVVRLVSAPHETDYFVKTDPLHGIRSFASTRANSRPRYWPHAPIHGRRKSKHSCCNRRISERLPCSRPSCRHAPHSRN